MVRRPRWPLYALAAVAFAMLSGLIAMPPIGAHLVRTRAIPRIEEKLGRAVRVGGVKLRWGSLELTDLSVDGAGGPIPLSVPRAVVRFRLLPLVRGRVALTSVTLDQPRVFVVRGESGDDNVSAILERLRQRRAEKPDPGAPAGRLSGPDQIEIRAGSLSLEDEELGAIEVGAFDASAHRDGAGSASLAEVELRLAAGPSGHAARVNATFSLKGGQLDGLPSLNVVGGGVKVWKGFAVSGIEGGISPDPGDGWRANIDLRGGYGGVDRVLWSARGWANPKLRQGALSLVAARFDLGQLAPILAGTPVIDPGEAQVDARLDLNFHGDDKDPKHLHDAVDFEGSFHLAGLSVWSPLLGPLPVRRLGADATLRGKLEPKAKTVAVDLATVDFRGVRATMTLAASKLGKRPAFRTTLSIAPIPCQAMLSAMPPELVPSLQGFKLSGTFKSDIRLAVDPDDLENVDFGSNVGIDGCTVVEAPSGVSADRLSQGFDHAVEAEPGQWLAFVIGPENPDWVPIPDVSRHLINSIMTTEDSTFLTHRGFIGREFKTALRSNLEHGYFRLGASSITMQMVKNVLLSREKTLSRKLQELFLTWYVERHLSKERILEIYFNAIEFGPRIYGIGRAARHYFGKAPKDLTPREATFFSSILPNPKKRYAHFCKEQLDQKWELYLNRILRRMHERGRLTDEEYEQAINSTLTFDRAEALPEKECLELVKRITTPPAAGGEKPAAKPSAPAEAAPEEEEGEP